ncbi:MAG: hypothetical protein V3T92_03015 [Anaerolineae bacterium]
MPIWFMIRLGSSILSLRRPEPFVPGHRTGPYGTVPKDQGPAEGSKGGAIST